MIKARVSLQTLTLLLGASAVLLLGATDAPPAPAPPASAAVVATPAAEVRGRVTDRGGRPIPGATVRIRPTVTEKLPKNEKVTTTVLRSGEDGAFLATALAGKEFGVRVEAAGFAPFTELRIPAGGSVAATLKPGHSLAGRLFDLEGSKPIAGAKVRACDADAGPFGRKACATVESDENGRFRLSDLAQGRQSLSITASAHAAGSINASAPAAIRPETGEPEEVLVFLGPGGRIAGRAVDAAGAPVEGAWISLRPLDLGRLTDEPRTAVETDAAGRFEAEGLPAGRRYKLSAGAEGRAPVEAGPFTVERGTDISDLVLRLSAGATLAFRLVDAEERPVTAVRVRIIPDGDRERGGKFVEDRLIEIDAEGGLRVAHLASGTNTVVLEPDCCRELERERVVLRDGETTDLGTIAVREGRSIAGRVTDEGDRPIAEAEVSTSWQEEGRFRRRSARTDAEGRYRIGGLGEEQELRLIEASAKGFVTERRQSPGSDRTALAFVLVRTGSVRGSVRLSSGEAARDFTVEAHREAGSPQAGAGNNPMRAMMGGQPEQLQVHDAKGEFTMPELEAGTYTVIVKAAGMAPARKTDIVVVKEQVADAGTLTLERGLTLRGRVVAGKDENPVAGAAVRVSVPGPFPRLPGRAAEPMAVAGLDGSFTLEGLEPGAVTVAAEHPDFSPAQAQATLAAGSEPEPVVLRLTQGATLTGSVRDAQGQPVAGAQVMLLKSAFGGAPAISTTAADGRYSFERQAAGSYMAHRMREGRLKGVPAMKSVTLEEGRTAVLDFDDQAGITLSGRVLRGKEPLAESRLIFVAGANAGTTPPEAMTSAVADGAGHYEVKLDRAGSYYVNVALSSAGRSQGLQLDVPDEPQVTRDIVLKTNAVSGSVTGSDGAPIAGGAFVAAVRDGAGESAGGRSGAQTDSSGRYALEGLEPGVWRLAASAIGLAPAERYPVTVTDGSDATIDFQLEEGRRLRGRVIDPSGRGLSGAMVVATRAGVPAALAGSTSMTDVNGVFELVTPAEGALDVTALATGWAPTRVEGVEPSGDANAPETIIQVSLGGRIRVTVVGPDGRPASGVRVGFRSLATTITSLRPFGQEPTPPTDAQGVTLALLLAPGSYQVSLVGRDGTAPEEVSVGEGQEAAVRLTLATP